MSHAMTSNHLVLCNQRATMCIYTKTIIQLCLFQHTIKVLSIATHSLIVNVNTLLDIELHELNWRIITIFPSTHLLPPEL